MFHSFARRFSSLFGPGYHFILRSSSFMRSSLTDTYFADMPTISPISSYGMLSSHSSMIALSNGPRRLMRL